MKKAVILVGSHYAGKGRTIREHLKPKLGIGRDDHKFTRDGQNGFVLAQSCEEANRDVQETVDKYSHYDLLVLAARPANESPSCSIELENRLETATFRVMTVEIIKSSEAAYYEGKADEIIGFFDDLGARTASGS
jgi:hypothetical protein